MTFDFERECIRTCAGTHTDAWKRVEGATTARSVRRGATAWERDRDGRPVAPRNCQLTFLPPCKKTRSYVPGYVATAHGTRWASTGSQRSKEKQRERENGRDEIVHPIRSRGVTLPTKGRGSCVQGLREGADEKGRKNRKDTFHYDYARNGLLIVSASAANLPIGGYRSCIKTRARLVSHTRARGNGKTFRAKSALRATDWIRKTVLACNALGLYIAYRLSDFLPTLLHIALSVLTFTEFVSKVLPGTM